GRAVLEYIENMVMRSNVPATEVAGILVEPFQGEGGYVSPPPGFLTGLRELCDRHGIMLIFDEVQTGIGRTGKMFAAEHEGVAADIMCLAKGLGSGMPIGLVVAKKRHMAKWARGAHGNTYGGNPVCCAAALATLDLVEKEYMHNARVQGEYLLGRLREMQQRHDCIGEVRGAGLWIGVELVESRETKVPAVAFCDRVLTRGFHNGLLLLNCGQSTLRLMPPLLVDRATVDEALVLLEQSLMEAAGA
ncbi:MAG: aspartate aminotransferase family protein, partial [Gammaproteobacteria bacterium]